jgi:hypothetical protein
VGAWSADPSGRSDAGKSYVVFGKANSPCLTIPSTHNQIIQAIAIDITCAGDCKSYVVFGKADSSAINLSAIVDADNPTAGGFVINGEAEAT